MTEVYDQNIKKLVQNGYAERVPEDEFNRNDGSVWYIPHHPVFKPGKLRPVFDCSVRYKGVSLNGECMQGPNLTNNLVHVLLRFWQFKYAIMADVESMYLQVRIPDADRTHCVFCGMTRVTWPSFESCIHSPFKRIMNMKRVNSDEFYIWSKFLLWDL